MDKYKVIIFGVAVILVTFTLSVSGYSEESDSKDNEDDGIGEEGKWIKYTPESDDLFFSVHDTEEGVIVKVNIRFNDLGHRVKDWGEVSREADVFSVNTEMQRYTGPAGQAIKNVEHSYNLGDLESGEYEFQLMTWNEEVTTVQFSVPEA